MRRYVFPALVAPAAVYALAAADDPKPAPADVPALIRQLGSPAFAEREAATQALGGIATALPALRAAATDKNPEVARRAADALRALSKGLGADRLKRLPEYVKGRQVDRMVATLVEWREAVTPDDREAPRLLARDILAWARREFGPAVPKVEVPDLRRGLPSVSTRLTLARDLDRWDIEDIIAESMNGGKPDAPTVARGGLVGVAGPYFVGGDLTIIPHRESVTWGGLVVCGGDYTTGLGMAPTNALVLCLGDVRLGFWARGSVVVAGGDITFDPPRLEEGSREAGAVFRPREPKLAEFLKFYDCAAEGLHVRAEDKAVSVTKADPGTPFAAAGLQPGDRILRVGGEPVRSVRELNRLLCRAEVGYPGTAALSLARGDKAVDAAVKLNDPPKLTP